MAEQIVVMIVTESEALERMTVAMLDAAGCVPTLPSADENAIQALGRMCPDAVLLDCEHPAAVSDRFFEEADRHRIGVLVYGRETREADIDLLARQQDVYKLPLTADSARITDALAVARRH